MNKWFERNKKLLIIFGVVSVILFALTGVLVICIGSNVDDLAIYAQTGELTTDLKIIGIVGMLDSLLLGGWVILLSLVLIQVLFPTKQAKHNALYLDELHFLTQIPLKIKKGVRNEQ